MHSVMDLGILVAIAGVVVAFLAIVNAWVLVLYSGIKAELKLVTKVTGDNTTKVAVLENDVNGIKYDFHKSSTAILESFSKLDSKLHQVIMQQGSKK